MKKIFTFLVLLVSFSSFAQWTENFDSFSSGSYITGTSTINSRVWTFKDAGNSTYSNSSMGSTAVTINDDKVSASITTPVLNTCASVSFDYAYINGSSTNVFELQVSTDDITYTTVDTRTLGASSNLTYVNYSFTINSSSSTTYVRILSDDQNAHLFIDNFVYTPMASSSPTITAGSTNMSGFTYELAAGPSTSQANTLEWANLTGNVASLNTVNNFEFSIDAGLTWNSASILTILIPPFPATSLSAIPVEVRMVSGLGIGTYFDTIVLESAGADTVEVFLEGEVTAPVVPCSELFISEYVESGNEKYIEIYNPTAAAISLSNYDLVIYFNSNTSIGQTISLGSSSLASGATFVVKYSSSVGTADISSGSLSFNGNDAVALRLSGVNIDEMGTIGSGNNYGESKTLTRLSTIDNPNDTYDVAEWTETTPFTIAGLGAHASDCIVVSCAISSITAGIQTACVPGTNQYTQEVTVTYSDEPATGTLDVNGQSFAITTSPQTVTLTGLDSDGNGVDVTASFSDLAICTLTEAALFTAPANCIPPLTPCSQLFISEYGEPNGGNDKYIEIYNPTSAVVDLSNYEIWVIVNGGSWPENTVSLSGTLAAGDVYVIANTSFVNPNIDLGNNFVGNTNGDDALGLAYNGGSGTTFSLIDAVGTDGADPGSGFAVAGIANGTQNSVITRKSSVQVPNTNWTTSAGTNATDSEWEVISYTGGMALPSLGSHTSDCIDYVWTGATDTDWSTASNWSSNVVPNDGNEVSIPDVSAASGNFPVATPSVSVGNSVVAANATLTVNTGLVLNGTFTNNGTVTLQNGAYLDDFTNAGSAFTGSIVIETEAANGISNDQRFIASPVNTPNVSEIGDDLLGPWGAGLPGVNGVAVTMDDCALATTTPTSNYGNLFEFDETIINTCEKDAWVVRSSGTLENARGYSAYLTNGSTFDFEGTPNTGAQSVNVTNSGSGVVLGEGWNLIGNPYPSPISRDDVITAGATDAQYFVTSGVYQGTFSPYLPSSNIAIAQGFQVHVNANATLNFDNSFRNTNAATWYQNDSWFDHKLEVSVIGASGADKTILFYNQDATNAYEAMYDVTKVNSNLGKPTLATTNNAKQLALNGMSVNDLGETVAMSLLPGTNGNFSLSFEGKETFPANTTIYVKDLQENIVHNIANGDYSFTSNTTDNADRFELIFIPAVEFTIAQIGCDNEAGSIALNTNIGLANRTYQISENGNVVSNDDLNNFSFETSTPANYEIAVNDIYGGVQNYSVEITAAEMIESEFDIPTEVFVGETFNLNSLVNNANELEWTIESSTITNVAQLTYSFETAGVYEISLTANSADCTDTETKTIVVNNKTTGISNLVKNSISVYPNPVNDVLHIEGNEVAQVEIFTVLGEKLLSTSETVIDMKDLNQGIYLINIFNANNELISVNKVVKK